MEVKNNFRNFCPNLYVSAINQSDCKKVFSCLIGLGDCCDGCYEYLLHVVSRSFDTTHITPCAAYEIPYEFTPRQLEIFRMVIRGCANAEMLNNDILFCFALWEKSPLTNLVSMLNAEVKSLQQEIEGQKRQIENLEQFIRRVRSIPT